MKCKDCKYYSCVRGGTCFGWADLSETTAEAEVGSCARFKLKTKEPDYISKAIERIIEKYEGDKMNYKNLMNLFIK